MPTRPELESFDGKLYSKVYRTGGIMKWADRLGLPLKTPYSNPKNNYGDKSKDEFIKDSIHMTMKKLNIDRMPSFSEIRNTHDNPEKILNLIRRNGGYKTWANKLELALKESDTKLGTDYEFIIMESLIDIGYRVDKMPIKFPYDLLVNDVTKIDVKTANLFHDKNRNTSMYKYTINKDYHTCDFYIFIALKEDDSILKSLVIPSHIVNTQNVSIGIRSKYDIYNEKFDLLEKHSNFVKNKLI